MIASVNSATNPSRCLLGKSNRPRQVRLLVALVGLLLAGGCVFPPRATAPIDHLWKEHPDGDARTLVIFLPGRGSDGGDYLRQGFVDALWNADWKADALLVDAHLGYYYTRTLDTRFREDLWPTVQARAYNEVWLVGISLGGLGSFLLANDFPIDGIVALAPYLGEDDELLMALKTAGGPVAWRPDETFPREREFFERILWQWLAGYGDGDARPATWLAYGDRDDFTPRQDLLATLLPRKQVLVRAGGHDWPTWKRLWAELLAERIPVPTP